MDFDDHEDPEGGLEMAVQQGGYDSLTGSRQRMGPNSSGDGTAGPRKLGPAHIRYRECLKNHALSLGGHAVDGCGEFMAAGEEGTLDALKCAACNCHRNFHRKETEGTEGGSGLGIYHHLQHHPAAQQQHHLNHFSAYYRAPPPSGYLHLTPPPQQHRPLALPAASGGGYSREEEDVSNPSSSGGAGGLRKRHRTKFTAEQKEKMLALAERLGWRIQKHDEAAVEEFCEETGVKRHVLKVWMHNNKHTLGGKKQEQQQPS